MRLRLVVSSVVVGALILSVAFPMSAFAVVMGNCSKNANEVVSRHTGWSFTNQQTYGAEAYVEHYNESLCTEIPGDVGVSLSTDWVALTGTGDPLEIFQIGEIKCNYAGCPTGNTYMWAYGRKGSASCSGDVHPNAHFLTTAPTTGAATYLVNRVTSGGSTYYSAQINGTEKATASTTSLDTCWKFGSKKAEFINEIYDTDDQVGGSVSNPNWFTRVEYRNTLQWLSMNETLSSQCNWHTPASAKCFVSPGVHDAFRIWDSRVP